MKFSIKKIAKADWEEAQKFFDDDDNKGEIKFRKVLTKGGREKGHSFVKINGVIYALNNDSKLARSREADAGKGGFGRVKYGISEKGDIICVKVTAEDRAMKGAIKEHLTETGYLLGQVIRGVKRGESGRLKAKDTLPVKAKAYTAMKYVGENDLYTEARAAKTTESKIVLGLYAMMEIESLHQARFLHRDIKPQNFMVNREGEHLTVLPIDLDDADRLLEGIQAFGAGVLSTVTAGAWSAEKSGVYSIGYAAPEVMTGGSFSYASDVYALGQTLKDMGLPRDLYIKMINDKAEKRIKIPEAIDEVVSYLQEKLREQPRNREIAAVLAAYESMSKNKFAQGPRLTHSPKASKVPSKPPAQQEASVKEEASAIEEALPKNVGMVDKLRSKFQFQKSPPAPPPAPPRGPARELTFGEKPDKIVGKQDIDQLLSLLMTFRRTLLSESGLPTQVNTLAMVNAVVEASVQTLEVCLKEKKQAPVNSIVTQLIIGLDNMQALKSTKREDGKKIESFKVKVLEYMQERDPSFEVHLPYRDLNKLGKKGNKDIR